MASTQNSADNAWNLNLSDGNMNNNYKFNQNRVRPVSALIKKTYSKKVIKKGKDRNGRFRNDARSISRLPQTKAEHSRRYGVRAELCSQLSRTDKRS
nr:MAG TPA: hypothetical protein [Caudoviricetes sp.]